MQFVEQQIGKLDQEIAFLLQPHQSAVERLASVPALGVDSAQQIIAEVGANPATFPLAGKLSSWVGACPGKEEMAILAILSNIESVTHMLSRRR
ncbi:MAG: transposase [Acidobacteria bacterium]|nr:transposase [Acidobacteriota bacterium]